MLNNYIDKLKELLRQNNIEDENSFIEYIEEMINDRLDAGESETDILNSLEDPEIVIKNIQSEATHSNFTGIKRTPIQQAATSEEKEYTFENTNRVSIELVNASLELYASDSLKTVVRVIDTNDSISVEHKNGLLKIEESPIQYIGWPFLKIINETTLKINNQVIIELPASEYEKLDLENVSGSIKINDVCFTKADIENVSGEIIMSDSSFEKASFESVSGSIIMTNIISRKQFKAEVVSGKLEIDTLDSNHIELESVSGNIDISILGDKQDYQIDIEKIMKEEHYNSGANKKLQIETVAGKLDYKFIN